VIAAIRTITRRTGPQTSGGTGGAGPPRPRRVGAGAGCTTSFGIASRTRSSSSKVRYGSEDGGVVWETRTISINNCVSSNSQVRALVSILALLIEIEEREATALDLSYTEEALVVDSIAFTVCRTIGLDTEIPAPAMSSWPQASPETIERAAEMVDQVAARIEEHVIQRGEQAHEVGAGRLIRSLSVSTRLLPSLSTSSRKPPTSN